jgi:hypothetical protein
MFDNLEVQTRMDDRQELRPLPNGIRLAGQIIVVKPSIANIESVYMEVLVFFTYTDHCPQNKQWRFSDRGTMCHWSFRLIEPLWLL